MGIQSVNHTTPVVQQYEAPQKQQQEAKEEAQKVQPKTDSFVKGESSQDYGYGRVKGLSRETVDALKEERVTALKNMVQKVITGQAEKATGMEVLSFDFKAIEISATFELSGSIYDDPIFGVDAMATRIMDMAVALSGGDGTKASALKDAVMNGFGQAEDAWGKKLPGVCEATRIEVDKRFEYWIENGTLEGYEFTGYEEIEEQTEE